ncbi:putative ATP-binding protein of sugar ABC transporter [Calothrix sp. NIES-4101]|nr:putative ATP-binding protein of sugar ABC transporter [Calothrix sp. NIES-4101]
MNLPRSQLKNITKFYSGNIANQEINLTIQPGEIHALLGENGAGKSTLMQILYGFISPDAGEIFWEGKQVKFNHPLQAKKLGIGMVFQHFSLFEKLTVTENVALALPQSGKFNLSQIDRKIRIISQEYGLKINPDYPVHKLSVGEKQRVEIIRCLCQATKLLILDEPTAVLTPQETDKLFPVLRKIAATGCSILFSSHKLDEVKALCHKATILRQGKVIAECNPESETTANLAKMMIGAELPPSRKRQLMPPGAVSLQVQDLSLPAQHQFATALQNINFQVCTGEIVGIAGVAGNGQQELLALLSGEVLSPQANMIKLGEMPIGSYGVAQRRHLGLGYVPEERLGKGVVPHLNLLENALLTAYGQGLLRRGLIRNHKLNNWTNRICHAFNVQDAAKNINPHIPINSLSGGNVQKFIMGREIQQNPAVLIAAHPTWGVDVKATAIIHDALIEMRDSGASVLVVSEDLDELLTLCDRIAVIYKGQVSELTPVSSISRNKIGELMLGIGFKRPFIK